MRWVEKKPENGLTESDEGTKQKRPHSGEIILCKTGLLVKKFALSVDQADLGLECE